LIPWLYLRGVSTGDFQEALQALVGAAAKNLSALFGIAIMSPEPDRLLEDGDEIALGTQRFKVLHVPGHTPGCVALYWPGTETVAGMLLSGDILFDDGDEVLIEDEDRMPENLVVVDYTGAFAKYEEDLIRFAASYARPINTRLVHVPNRDEFVEKYVTGMLDRFREIQQTYRDNRAAFDMLFAHRPEQERGSMSHRWRKVLQRLDQTDTGELERQLCRHLRTESPAIL
jgi:hypothetical protein